MRLPIVSMEDAELFPKRNRLLLPSPEAPFPLEAFDRLNAHHDKLWWSRLVISVRGYVINYVQAQEEKLFLCDDAFIQIHVVFAERTHQFTPSQFVRDLATVAGFPGVAEALAGLERDPEAQPNPWRRSESAEAFCRVFGRANAATYRTANLQKDAYLVFAAILHRLVERWDAESGSKRKGIRFDTDPEWQPDDRVVLFQQFYEGNRTWVLTDFDRHVIAFWKPNGANVVFGDRYIEKKKRAGFALCDHCGMLEQVVGQFPQFREHRFCSEQCLASMLDANQIAL
uniref:YHS domain-containing protein n=1 Tax=Steinernema glaseri TaxID=37863 RepID=A0A1I7ZLR7_9BILA